MNQNVVIDEPGQGHTISQLNEISRVEDSVKFSPLSYDWCTCDFMNRNVQNRVSDMAYRSHVYDVLDVPHVYKARSLL